MLVKKSDPRLKHLDPKEFEWTEITEDDGKYFTAHVDFTQFFGFYEKKHMK